MKQLIGIMFSTIGWIMFIYCFLWIGFHISTVVGFLFISFILLYFGYSFINNDSRRA